MNKKLPLLLAGSLASAALFISSLSAADSPAPAPAASSASAAPAAPAASAAPAAGSAPAERPAPKADMSKVPAASDKKDLTFDKDIAPLFKASCVSCHGGAKPSSGLDLSTKEGALKGGRGKNDIVAGHGDQSNVVLFASDAVAKSEMPPLRARTRAQNPVTPLTKDQVALVRAWIDQGAK
jgi:streptogramin lyase